MGIGEVMGFESWNSDILKLVSNQSLGSDFVTPWHETMHHDMGAIQLWWSGADAITGTFIVQFSLDTEHWSDSVDPSNAATVCAGSGSAYFEFTDITCRYWRVKYTKNTVSAGVVDILSALKRRR